MKVVLADDHALFRDGFALLLKQHEAGAAVFEAATLEEARQQLSALSHIDLLLLDLAMPGMKGVQSVEALLRDYPGLPIVILSATESQDQVEALLDAGVSGYIPKSSSARLILPAIRLVLAGGIYIPPQYLAMEDEARRAEFLTARQKEVLGLIARGLSNSDISRALNLRDGTVKSHVYAIFRTLNVASRASAAEAARRLRLVR